MAQHWNQRGGHGGGWMHGPRPYMPRMMAFNQAPPHMAHGHYVMPPIYHQNRHPRPPLPLEPPPMQPPPPAEPEPYSPHNCGAVVPYGGQGKRGFPNKNQQRRGKKRLATDYEQAPVPKNKVKQGKVSQRWNKEDADKAEAAEKGLESNDGVSLTITFPDFELNQGIVQNIDKDAITKVYFPSSFGPRTCFVTLDPDADVEAAIKKLKETKFGNGYPEVTVSQKKQKDLSCLGDTIDPYTLFIGNLPMNIHANDIKRTIPWSTRCDMGFSQKAKRTRYAYLRFETVEGAIEGLNAGRKAVFGGRTALCRFQRFKKVEAPIPPATKDGQLQIKGKEDDANAGSSTEPDVQNVLHNMKVERFDSELQGVVLRPEDPSTIQYTGPPPDDDDDDTEEDEYQTVRSTTIPEEEEDEGEEEEEERPTPEEIRRREERAMALVIKPEPLSALDGRILPPLAIKTEPVDYSEENTENTEEMLAGPLMVERVAYTGPPPDDDDDGEADDDF